MGSLSEFQAAILSALRSTIVTWICGFLHAITAHVGPPGDRKSQLATLSEITFQQILQGNAYHSDRARLSQGQSTPRTFYLQAVASNFLKGRTESDIPTYPAPMQQTLSTFLWGTSIAPSGLLSLCAAGVTAPTLWSIASPLMVGNGRMDSACDSSFCTTSSMVNSISFGRRKQRVYIN